MPTEIPNSSVEEKEIIKGAGCLNILLASIIPFILLYSFADETHIFITLMMCFLTFFGLMLAFQGLVILSLPIVLVKMIFKRNTDKYFDDRKFEKSRIWVVFPIAIIIFYLGNLLVSNSPNDNFVYPAVGFAFALALYLMTKKDYFHPTEYME